LVSPLSIIGLISRKVGRKVLCKGLDYTKESKFYAANASSSFIGEAPFEGWKWGYSAFKGPFNTSFDSSTTHTSIDSSLSVHYCSLTISPAHASIQ
jgi:hypothetical protein